AHLPNVRNYPLVQIDSYSNSKKNRIYLISQSGKRSEEAAKILRNKGYKAINVKGGLDSWTGKLEHDKWFWQGFVLAFLLHKFLSEVPLVKIYRLIMGAFILKLTKIIYFNNNCNVLSSFFS